jgi:hypothetical protein
MSGYIGSTPVPQATQHRESFTCTEGQTTFNTAGYTAQFVDVYLNGSHLSPADFTATNGSDVVLGVAASADDVCDIISYTPFEVANQTFTGTTTLDGAVVINESSADVDFRVESDNQTHAVFVQGSDGFVGINIAAPTAPLHIQAADNADLLRFTVSGQEVWAFKGASAAGSNDTVSFGIAGGTQAMAWDENGICTKPAQPAFLATPASQQANLAVGSAVDIAFGTEVFDNNADFASSVFTAPVTGRYQLSFQLRVDAIDSNANYYQFKIVTSNRTYTNIFAFGAATYYNPGSSILADMDAGDTAKLQFVQGTGTAQSDIDTESYFSGILVA